MEFEKCKLTNSLQRKVCAVIYPY